MRNVLYLIFFLGLIILLIGRWTYPHYFKPSFITNSLSENIYSPVLDSYDPANMLDFTAKDVFHLKLTLNNADSWNIDTRLLKDLAKDQAVMITVEPWGSRFIGRFATPLEELVSGVYDERIRKLCHEVFSIHPKVYIRFAQEMEIPSHSFPWIKWGRLYIEAYRHFVGVWREELPDLQFVWGPLGYPGALEFYPGEDMVDICSITLRSSVEIHHDVYPNDLPLPYDIQRRLHRLRFVEHPILILGSENLSKEQYSTSLLSQAQDSMRTVGPVVYSHDLLQNTNAHINPSPDFHIGMYDPDTMLVHHPAVDVEHIFPGLAMIRNEEFETMFHDILRRNHDAIVTFEPFKDTGATDLKVLRNILKGKYDDVIAKFYSIISSTDRIVYLRFGHEMEIPITRYPWQSQDPSLYILAYRYFMTFNDSLAPNIRRVWGPAGDRGSIEWYPGNDVVDFISMAIYGLPDKNITDPQKQESFSTIFRRKYHRLRFIDKPLFITEFGVKGPEEFQRLWMEDAAKTLNENPQVAGVSYFNFRDVPKAWGDIPPPVWSITEETFDHFLSTLNNKPEVAKQRR